MARRGRHEGSVFELPDGSWVGSISLGTKIVDGKPKRIRKVFYGARKADVLKRMQEFRDTQSTTGVLTTPARLTTSAYLGTWLKDVVRPGLRPKTVECYEDTVRLYIDPQIGGIPLLKLDSLAVQSMMSNLEKDGKSPRVRQLTRSVLRRALQHAVGLGIIRSNPVAAVKGPRVPKRPETIWDAEQAKRYLVVNRNDRDFAMDLLAISTGMREGELLALYWEDVDLKTGVVRVRFNLTEIDGKILGRFEPKTKAGVRNISLSANVVAALKAHRMRLFSEGLAACPYVFPNTEGRPFLKSNLLKAFKKRCAVAYAPVIRYHDLRHTCATLLLGEGVQPKVVQERFGHSDLVVTLGTYGHVLPGQQRAASDVMQNILTGAEK
jgi:integrase